MANPERYVSDGQEWFLFFRTGSVVCSVYSAAPGRWEAFARVAGLTEAEAMAVASAMTPLILDEDQQDGQMFSWPAFDFNAEPVAELEKDPGAYLLALRDCERWKDDNQFHPALRSPWTP